MRSASKQVMVRLQMPPQTLAEIERKAIQAGVDPADLVRRVLAETAERRGKHEEDSQLHD